MTMKMIDFTMGMMTLTMKVIHNGELWKLLTVGMMTMMIEMTDKEIMTMKIIDNRDDVDEDDDEENWDCGWWRWLTMEFDDGGDSCDDDDDYDDNDADDDETSRPYNINKTSSPRYPFAGTSLFTCS